MVNVRWRILQTEGRARACSSHFSTDFAQPGRCFEPRGGNWYGRNRVQSRKFSERSLMEAVMANFGLLHYAIIFLVVALIAAAVGFGGVAGVAMEGARLLFWIFIVLFVVSVVAGLIRRRT
jgi:uncharacterized membrane protein YtjA (UPF0391 family)